MLEAVTAVMHVFIMVKDAAKNTNGGVGFHLGSPLNSNRCIFKHFRLL